MICIVLVGVSITRTTSNFISSRSSGESFAMEEAQSPQVFPRMASADARNGQTNAAAGASANGSGEGQPEAGASEAAGVPSLMTASLEGGTEEEPVGSSPDESGVLSSDSPSSSEDSAGSGGEAGSETGEASAKEAARMAAPALSGAYAAEGMITEETSVQDGAENGQNLEGSVSAAQPESASSENGSVKSPLETAAAQEEASPFGEEEASYTSEELYERLEAVKQQAAQYQAAADTGQTSLYMAAEYEWNLWDRELNLIYSCIQSHMSETESEKLKKEEVEWLKERDLAAERAYVNNSSPPEQSAEYVRISAEKTKERCYELLEDYESVIDRAAAEETKPSFSAG